MICEPYITYTKLKSDLNIGFVGDILRVTATKGVDMKNMELQQKQEFLLY